MYIQLQANVLNQHQGNPFLLLIISFYYFYISSVLGHEAVVEVVNHRRPESDLAVGDRLTFSIADSCGQCEHCLAGFNQKCVKLFKVGERKNNHNFCVRFHTKFFNYLL